MSADLPTPSSLAAPAEVPTEQAQLLIIMHPADRQELGRPRRIARRLRRPRASAGAPEQGIDSRNYDLDELEARRRS